MNSPAMYRSVMNRYKPLSEAEERELIAAERHNEEHLRDLLMLHSMSGAVSIAFSYCRERMDSFDDAVQRAMIGLYKASRAFDLDRGVRFFTYASWQVIRDVIYIGNSNLKDAKINARMISLDAPLSVDESSDSTLADVVRTLMAADVKQKDGGDEFVDKICEDDWKALVFRIVDSCTRFSEKHRSIFKRYLEELSFQAVGTEYGISREAVRQVVRKMAKVVRMKLSERYTHDSEVARLLVNFNRHKRETAWQSKAYRYALGTDDALKKEEEHLEAVMQEKPSDGEVLLSRHEASPCSSGVMDQGSPRRKLYSSRSCAKTMNYSEIDGTRQRKYKTDVHFRPESMDRRLQELFAQERMRYKMRHATCRPVLPSEQSKPSPVPIGKRDEDEPTEQDMFAAEVEERIARHNEMQTANGSHFDDIYELQDEN